ncbi:MAG: DUF1330 domain-containing protein [Candidatus Omnitrophica bacterium]|nr:DUF1330 domain-containing protein [Candidatus Omnitrophota bacterium]
MVIEIAVHDKNMYAQYIEEVYPIVKKYGGTYLVRTENVAPITGNWHPERIIILRFKSITALQRCFQSAEYTRISHLREDSTTSKAIIVDGYPSLKPVGAP